MAMSSTRREVLLGIVAAAGGAYALRSTDGATFLRAHARAARKAAVASIAKGYSTDLEAGTKFGTCTLASIAPECDGAIQITLTDSAGAAFVVEAMRHDAAAPGVARAGSLAVYLRNGGDGSTASHEEHGLAAMAVASEIARRQAAGARVQALATVRERARA
jgi:hypothetical protein